MHRNSFPFLALVGLLATTGCDDKPKPSTTSAPTASAPKAPAKSAKTAASAKPLPPLVLKDFEQLGMRFRYPEPYVVEIATSNPEVHQVAVDHNNEPGVLTIRFNPKDPKAAIDLDEVAEATRQRMGAKAIVEPSKLDVAGKTYEARTVRANQLGLVETVDVMAVVELGGRNHVVLTHVSKGDEARAKRLFDTVLGSLVVE